MRTLHVGLRVADLEPSLGFYEKLGYDVVGRVPDTWLHMACAWNGLHRPTALQTSGRLG